MKKFIIEMTQEEAFNFIEQNCCEDLDSDEKELIFDNLLRAIPMFKDEISAHLSDCIDEYIEDIRPQYLRDLAEGRAENDAYERFRQKQIDGEV